MGSNTFGIQTLGFVIVSWALQCCNMGAIPMDANHTVRLGQSAQLCIGALASKTPKSIHGVLAEVVCHPIPILHCLL